MSDNEYILSYSYRGGPWQQVPLHYGIFTIGRSSDCEVCFPDDGISRRHAQLELSAAE
jgi:hypothetical protein